MNNLFINAGRKWSVLLAVTAMLLGYAAPASAHCGECGHSHNVEQRAEEGGTAEGLLFYLFAGLTLGSGLAICVARNIVRMAVFLFVTLSSVAALYFLLLANFIAVIQLIVYAGGTLILLIFGVMLTSKSPWARFDTKRTETILAGAVCLVLASALLWVVTGAQWNVTSHEVTGPTVAVFGRSLMSAYLVPFEVVSVLLLVVMIGAAYLARQE